MYVEILSGCSQTMLERCLKEPLIFKMNIRTLPCAFGSILLSLIFLFLSLLHFFLLLPITSVMASFVFTPFPHLPVPPPMPLPHFATLPHPPSWSPRSFFPPFISPPTSSSIFPSALLHLPLTFQLDVSAPPGTSGEKMDEVHSGFFSSRLFISFSVCFKFHLN